jgi:hypothetical protein
LTLAATVSPPQQHSESSAVFPTLEPLLASDRIIIAEPTAKLTCLRGPNNYRFTCKYWPGKKFRPDPFLPSDQIISAAPTAKHTGIRGLHKYTLACKYRPTPTSYQAHPNKCTTGSDSSPTEYKPDSESSLDLLFTQSRAPQSSVYYYSPCNLQPFPDSHNQPG